MEVASVHPEEDRLRISDQEGSQRPDVLKRQLAHRRFIRAAFGPANATTAQCVVGNGLGAQMVLDKAMAPLAGTSKPFACGASQHAQPLVSSHIRKLSRRFKFRGGNALGRGTAKRQIATTSSLSAETRQNPMISRNSVPLCT